MNPASIDDLLKVVPNKYLLTMVVAARAKQLEQGAESLVDFKSTNSLDIAIKEIAEGKIDVSAVLEQSKNILDNHFNADFDVEDAGVGEYIDYGTPDSPVDDEE